VLDGPAGQPVQGQREVIGHELGDAVRHRRAGELRRRGLAGREPVPQPRGGTLPLAQAGGRTLGHDAPARDQRHPVSEVLRLVHVVGGEQHGLAERSQVLDHGPCLVPGRRIEAGGGLVEEQQVRIAGQGNRHI